MNSALNPNLAHDCLSVLEKFAIRHANDGYCGGQRFSVFSMSAMVLGDLAIDGTKKLPLLDIQMQPIKKDRKRNIPLFIKAHGEDVSASVELEVADVACPVLSVRELIAKGCAFMFGEHEGNLTKDGVRVRTCANCKTFLLQVPRQCRGSDRATIVTPMDEESTVVDSRCVRAGTRPISWRVSSRSSSVFPTPR